MKRVYNLVNVARTKDQRQGVQSLRIKVPPNLSVRSVPGAERVSISLAGLLYAVLKPLHAEEWTRCVCDPGCSRLCSAVLSWVGGRRGPDECVTFRPVCAHAPQTQ